MIRKVTDLNKTAHKSKRKPFSKRRLQYLLHKSEVLSNQYKVERDKFEQMLNKECECGFQMEGKYHDMKVERNSLIDDLSWYKANISRLERENEKLRKVNSNGWKQKDEVANKLISDIKSKDNLLSEFSQHIGSNPSSSTYKKFRKQLDDIGIREIKK
ncbi:hypothetical protein [Staphylococcus saprophyticus]|uniref:hypothetical protein n=1 Tax=Staphylococcus saprophyticus TaxID=29385 RepID=UPI00374EF017